MHFSPLNVKYYCGDLLLVVLDLHVLSIRGSNVPQSCCVKHGENIAEGEWPNSAANASMNKDNDMENSSS